MLQAIRGEIETTIVIRTANLSQTFKDEVDSGSLNSRRVTRTCPVSVLAERFAIGIFIESDQHCFADFHRRGPEVASRAKHHGDKFIVIRTVFFEIYLSDFFTLGHNQL